MGIKRALAAACIIAVAAVPAEAQLGGAIGVRSVSGDEADAASADRRGFELRAFWDGAFKPALGWRAELAFTQMQYQTPTGLESRKDSESGIEFSTVARADALNGALSGAYLVLGPLVSLQLKCGTSGGFVECAEGPAQRVGYVAGVGYRTAISERRDILFEVRYLGRPVSGAGADVMALTIGLRQSRR
jgi:hypothetical protein